MSTPVPSQEPFTLRDVLVDALDTLREDARAHLGWSLIWIAMAMTSCCGITVLIGGIGAIVGLSGTRGEAPEQRLATLGPMVALVYLVVLPWMLALYSAHQAVAMDIARARGRGVPVTMREAIVRGLSRVPALLGHVLLRLVFEGVPLFVVYLAVFAVLWVTTDLPSGGWPRNLGPLAWLLIAVVYVLILVAAFAYRGFYGLAFPCIVDGAGPYAAFGASRALLAGRRLQFVGFRLAVLAAWFLAYGLCMGPYFVVAFRDRPDPSAALMTLPLMLGFYAVMYFLILLDALMEAAFHVRVTRSKDASEIAKTFD